MAVQDTTLDHDRLAPQLAAIVREAGAMALDHFRRGVRRWTKDDASPVTEADIAVDRFLHARLPGLVAGSGWLSEETADTPDRLGRSRVWIVDPIDGTRAFAEGDTSWVVSVALVEAGRPVMAAIYSPCAEEFFSAEAGRGARLGSRALSARPAQSLDGLSFSGPVRLVAPLERHGLVHAGRVFALAYRLAQVADRRFDIALAGANAKDWDIAAADLILSEAGARLTGFDGAAPAYNRPRPVHPALIAAADTVHPALISGLAAART